MNKKNKIIINLKQAVSRILSRMIIYLGSRSPETSSNLPENQTKRAASLLLFGLAPDGVYHAPAVTDGTVGSYPTFSPLPRHKVSGRYFFCGTFHGFTPTSRYEASCPVEFGLSSSRHNMVGTRSSVLLQIDESFNIILLNLAALLFALRN